jgi:rsbT antagonist protein RsbS
MAVPILKQGELLIACLQNGLTDRDLLKFNDDLADRMGAYRSRGVIIDISALDVLDSFATRMLRGIVETTKLRGSTTVIVGMQPEVALAMTKLGLTLDRVSTALDLEDGLAFFGTAQGTS